MTGKKFERFLDRAGMNVKEFARVLDVDARQVRRWRDEGTSRWLGVLLELVDEGRLKLDDLRRDR
jgi:hypothetical protein